MDLIDRIDEHARAHPNTLAHMHADQRLSYAELRDDSDALAARLETWLPGDRSPVVIYGHKDPLMLICLLACLKAGHAYVPIDTSWPSDRIHGVIQESETPLVLAVEDLPSDPHLDAHPVRIITRTELRAPINPPPSRRGARGTRLGSVPKNPAMCCTPQGRPADPRASKSPWPT